MILKVQRFSQLYTEMSLLLLRSLPPDSHFLDTTTLNSFSYFFHGISLYIFKQLIYMAIPRFYLGFSSNLLTSHMEAEVLLS